MPAFLVVTTVRVVVGPVRVSIADATEVGVAVRYSVTRIGVDAWTGGSVFGAITQSLRFDPQVTLQQSRGRSFEFASRTGEPTGKLLEFR